MRYVRMLRGATIVVPAVLVALSMTAPVAGAASRDGATSSRANRVQIGQRPLTPALARELSRNVTDKVIIVLRDQFKKIPDTPANSARRTAAVRAAQRRVLQDLAATHARNVKSISIVNAVAATVSRGEASRLEDNSAVAEVTPDLPIPVLASPPVVKPAKGAVGVTPLPGACPAKTNGVQLNPEAIENIHAASQPDTSTAQGLGYTGAGVKVAWIADGLDPNNPDFVRANGKHVFVDYQDFSGTGTSAPTSGAEAFLDASSIAAQGREVYNIQNYGVGLSRPCLIRILGVAPGSSLVGLNVFGSSNLAFNSVFLEAINYAVNVDHVNVINESFGANPWPNIASLDLTRQADDAAVAAGVTVVAASGDAGVTNTIGSPATDPEVISAGATTTYRAYAQAGIGGITSPGVTGWIDNNISGLSSGGFDQAGGTVDVVAPGDVNWALCTPKPALFFACTSFAGQPASVELQGGTSEAAPLTAGTAALVIQAYREGHHRQTPSPAIVKKIIVSTAQDISAPAEQQGAGMIDAYQAVLAARSYAGTTQTKKGHAILESATQFNAVDPASTTEHFSDTLTNDGSGPVTVHLSSRTLSVPTTVASGMLKLLATNGYVATTTFTVPPGQARLKMSVTLPGAIDLSLFSPSGKLAEFNLPQGTGNYANAQVAKPAPGTWTAGITGFPDNPLSTVNAPFLATTSRFVRFGSLSASSVTLLPGATAPISLTVPTPSAPGDEAGAIVLRSSASEPWFAAVTTIPVTLRSLVPTPASNTTFTGTLTGGNGRNAGTGQTAYYEFDMRPGQRALNASIEVGNPADRLFAELVDPAGEVASAANNTLLATSPGGNTELVPERGAQLHVLNPVAGRWTLIVDFYNAVSGTAVEQPFTVGLNIKSVKASETGLPTHASTKLVAGTPVTADVTVKNSGDVPEEYFVDARLDTSTTLNLAAQTTSTPLLPNLFGPVPAYLVPSLTTSLSAKVTASAVNFFDLTYPFGDPDLFSTVGTTSTVTFAPASNDIPNGDWTVTPFLQGPDGKNGVTTPVIANVTVKAVTAAIDPRISAPTGDLWDGSANAFAAFTPYVVEPGQSVTIPVTITPHGSSGTVVTGTLYVADSSFNPGAVSFDQLFGNFPAASNVASFQYTYTIK